MKVAAAFVMVMVVPTVKLPVVAAVNVPLVMVGVVVVKNFHSLR